MTGLRMRRGHVFNLESLALHAHIPKCVKVPSQATRLHSENFGGTSSPRASFPNASNGRI